MDQFVNAIKLPSSESGDSESPAGCSVYLDDNVQDSVIFEGDMDECAAIGNIECNVQDEENDNEQSVCEVNGDTDRSLHDCRWAGCNRQFSRLDKMVAHVNDDHVRMEEVDYTCKWDGCCRQGRSFNARYKMLIHMRTHTNEKPHACPACGKRFSRMENLKIHTRSHTGEKPYVCPVKGCGKAYSNSSDRFKHTRIHYDEKPFVCKKAGCGKRYTDPSSLRKHTKTFGHREQLMSTSSVVVRRPTTIDRTDKEDGVRDIGTAAILFNAGLIDYGGLTIHDNEDVLSIKKLNRKKCKGTKSDKRKTIAIKETSRGNTGPLDLTITID